MPGGTHRENAQIAQVTPFVVCWVACKMNSWRPPGGAPTSCSCVALDRQTLWMEWEELIVLSEEETESLGLPMTPSSGEASHPCCAGIKVSPIATAQLPRWVRELATLSRWAHQVRRTWLTPHR